MVFDDPRGTPTEKYRYMACIDMPEALPASVWEEMMPQSLPGGAYARYRHVGKHEEISGVISAIREKWRNRTGVVLAKERLNVEIYLDDPQFCDADKLRTDLCIPVAFAEELEVA